MKNYTVKTEELNKIIELLYLVVKMRITFFDIKDEEMNLLSIRERSPFCRANRPDASFNQKCIECDKIHLIEAKKSRNMQIYLCHAGLWEGIIPLYDKHGIYIGAIFFGQLADENNPIENLRSSSYEEMKNIGNLIKYLSEYIAENELIKQSMQSWQQRLERYVNNNLTHNISISELSEKLGCSASYLSHKIPDEFGMSLKKYIRLRRMEIAKQYLQQDKSIGECAFLLGYKDQFHFSKDFKKTFSISPSQWKKNHL